MEHDSCGGRLAGKAARFLLSSVPDQVRVTIGHWPEKAGWRTALRWGFGVALAHRLLLGVWMALVWLTISPWTAYDADFDATRVYNLPQLGKPVEQLVFGVWRRWDAVHYLDLAVHGYQPEHPGPTVFGPLTPFAFWLFDVLLPGPVDLGAMVVATLAFGLALTLLFQLYAVDYGDEHLARWAVGITALQPLSYFFAAPMSESLYLALTLGMFYAAYRGRWFLASLCGMLATLARTQGALLVVMAGLILLETGRSRRETIRQIIKRGWSLPLIPLGALLFAGYREWRGLPPLSDVYARYSFLFYTDPLNGLVLNVRHFIHRWPHTLYDTDLLALGVSLVLGAIMLRSPRHQRLPMVVYTWLYLLLFVSKVNRDHFTQVVTNSQSFGRYALALFPLTVLVADGISHIRSTRLRFVCVVGVALVLIVFSARHVLYLIGP